MANILILIDGMQDIAYDSLGGQTPYEYGRGESMRRLEAESARARFVSVPEGFEPDTKDCTLTLLGVPVKDIPRGRCYLEAIAEGVEVGDNDIVMRCNFVEVDEQGRLSVPCFHAPPEIAEPLLAAVRETGSFLKPVGPYKSLQVIKGERKSAAGMTTNPPHNYSMSNFEGLLPKGNALANALAAKSRELLAKHSPYTVFNWGQAVKEPVPAFSDIYGISGAVVTKTLVLQGIAKAMRMECPDLVAATGDTDTDLPEKARVTLKMLKKHKFVLLHIGGTDEATHRQDEREKAEFIRKIDRELLGPILEGCEEGTRILFTCDHGALCSTSGHTSDAVEAMLWQKGKKMGGDLGLLDGNDAVRVLMG